MATTTITTEKRVVLSLDEQELRAVQALCLHVAWSGDVGKIARDVYYVIRGLVGELDALIAQHGPYYLEGPVEFPNPLPAPEPEPLTLDDIKPGEWFTRGDGYPGSPDHPLLRVDCGAVAFCKGGPTFFKNPDYPARRLALDEAREMARAKNYPFPF